MYQIIDEKIIGRKVDTNSDFLQLKVVHIVCDTAASVPEPLPEWAAGSRCDVLANSGNVYILSISGEWKQVNFYNRGGEGGGFDPDAYYTKPQTDARITEKVAEIVADAPEDFNTLKEMSDWIDSHEDSAAAMNTAIQQNTTAIAGKVDKVSGKGLSTNDYTTEEKTKLASISANVSDVGQLYPNSNHGEIFNGYEYNVASGSYSHAEGSYTSSEDLASHAEGAHTLAKAYASHAEGAYTSAIGQMSHAEGQGTNAYANFQHAQGRYNVIDKFGKYVFIIGNGTDNEHRSDAFAVDWNGLIYQNNSATGVDLNNKVDKVSGKGLSTNDYTNADKTKLAGLENYDDSDLKSEIAVLTETGVKNLLKNNYAGQTVTNAGATFVSDENGVISVSGTVGTSWGTVYIFGTWSGTETVLDCSDGNYILSVESTTDNVRVSLNDRTSGTVSTIASIDGNGSQTFSGKITAVAVGAKTGTFENDTIKIMIRRAEIHDETFQPYAPTNRELYEMILALQNP